MQCNKADCKGSIVDGICTVCKQPAPATQADNRSAKPVPAQAIQDPPQAKQEPPQDKGDVPKKDSASSKPAPSVLPETPVARTQAPPTDEMGLTAAYAAFENDKRKSAPQNLKKLSARLQAIDERSERGKEELMRAASVLEAVRPDKFEAWRAQADLWLAAIRQLEKRQLGPDDSVILLGVPLRENQLRDAAEKALRHCAHLATSIEQRIALVDEANSIRRMTWF